MGKLNANPLVQNELAKLSVDYLKNKDQEVLSHDLLAFLQKFELLKTLVYSNSLSITNSKLLNFVACVHHQDVVV
jgi:hypothetical protein